MIKTVIAGWILFGLCAWGIWGLNMRKVRPLALSNMQPSAAAANDVGVAKPVLHNDVLPVASNPVDCAWIVRSLTVWCELIEFAARDAGVEKQLIAAVILQESSGNPSAISKVGAVGLMQIMPCDNGYYAFPGRPDTQTLLDPAYNITWGSHFLAKLIKDRGGVRQALRAYSGGYPDDIYTEPVIRYCREMGGCGR